MRARLVPRLQAVRPPVVQPPVVSLQPLAAAQKLEAMRRELAELCQLLAELKLPQAARQTAAPQPQPAAKLVRPRTTIPAWKAADAIAPSLANKQTATAGYWHWLPGCSACDASVRAGSSARTGGR